MMDSPQIDTMTSTTALQPESSQPDQDRDLLSFLIRDPFVRIALVLFGLLSLPYVIPAMSDEWMQLYGSIFVDLPLLVLLVVAVRFRLRDVSDPAERRFWTVLSFAPALWLGMGLLDLFFASPTQWSTTAIVFTSISYLFFYAAVAVAVETCPHLPPERMYRRLATLNRIGAFAFLFGSLLYFTVLPGLFASDVYWGSFLSLFVVIDVYIIVRLVALRHSTRDAAWRSLFGWMLLASAMWCASDVAEMLIWQEILPFVDSGTVWDLLWPFSFAVFVVGVRSSAYHPTVSSGLAPARFRLGTGPLVVYVVAAPILHLLAHRLGWADPELRPFREVLVVLFASVIAGMALAYEALLRRENRRLAEEESIAQERLEHQAYHDELTDLPNRSLFSDHLRLAIARARRYRSRCAVLFFDLDQFKVVNDSLGHEVGDRILVILAERLRTKVREVDTVARFGGDEFSVLVQDVHEVLDAVSLAENLLAVFNEPVVVEGKEHVLTTSLGIALYPDDGEDEATLLKHADIAMYQAKRKGRNTYKLFTAAMNEAAEERLAVEQGLRDALSNECFEVHYQPIIDLVSRRPIGCEALLRWNHPTKGLIEPADFIGVAEQTGLIVAAGEWVLEAACTWAQRLDSSLALKPSVAVNLSPRQLQERNFAGKLEAILDRTGLDPSRLLLEITESMAIETTSTAAILVGLRNLGIRIAIDDLGTGFSSLSRLRDLPMDVVKIDRSFIRRIHDDPVGEAIVRGVVGIAKALDLYVVAEGVETEEQLAVVEQLDCDAVQGFLLYRPLPPEDVEGLLGES